MIIIIRLMEVIWVVEFVIIVLMIVRMYIIEKVGRNGFIVFIIFGSR